MMKDKFSPDYSSLCVEDLIQQALNEKAVSRMDGEEKAEMIHELASRLQRAMYDLRILER